MPETQALAAVVPADIVRSFYAAVNGRDADLVGALVDGMFAADACLELPPSLPYGGRVEGARRLRRVFVSLASGAVDTGPRTITVQAVVGGQVAGSGADNDSVVAVLDFEWFPPGASEPVPSGACEVWRFRDGQVAGIRAYYWDTAALRAASAPTVEGA